MEVGGLIGLVFGGIASIIGLIVGRRQAKKERALDEVNDYIWQKARSISWYASLITIYMLLFLALIGLMTSLIKALSILLIVHLFTWGTVGAYLSTKLFGEEKADRQLHYFTLILFIVLGFTFITLITFYW